MPPALDPNKVVVEIFCSYAHEDEPLRQQFEDLLKPLRRRNLIDLWHDRRIEAGQHFDGVIDDRLDTADLIVLLVSRDFLASDYSCNKEVPRAMEREAHGEARVVPLIVRACDWTDEPFGALQAIPTDGKPVESWPKADEAWLDVSYHIKQAVKTTLEQRLRHETEAARQAAAKPDEFFTTRTDVLADAQEARRIYSQIARDAEKQKLERERIMQDLQARIFAVDEEIGPAKRVPKKSVKDACGNMDKYIRGE